MVNACTGLEVQSTVDSFTERPSDAPVYAAGLVQLSARTATMADSMDVAALAEAAVPQYIFVIGSLYQTPPVDSPGGVLPLSRTTVPFPSLGDGLVVLDLFSCVATTLLSLLRKGTKARRYFSVKTSSVARQVQRA